MLWGLTHFFLLMLRQTLQPQRKGPWPWSKILPSAHGINMKIVKTLLGRQFLSISWLKWFIVAYSTIALHVFFFTKSRCARVLHCFSLCGFDKYRSEIPTWADPLCKVSERERRERWGVWRWGWGTGHAGSSGGGQCSSTWAQGGCAMAGRWRCRE